MKITVNDKSRKVTDGATLAEVVASVLGDRPAKGVAVAVNGEVVPRSRWPKRSLQDDDRVEIVTAAQGG